MDFSWIDTLIGFMVGAAFMLLLMCILIVGSEADNWIERRQRGDNK